MMLVSQHRLRQAGMFEVEKKEKLLINPRLSFSLSSTIQKSSCRATKGNLSGQKNILIIVIKQIE